MNPTPSGRPDISIFGEFHPHGGTERIFLNHIRVWDRWGYRVELVGYRGAVVFYPDEMPERVRFVDLGTRGKWSTLIKLWRYCRSTQPRVVLGKNHLANMILMRCARLPGLQSRFYIGVRNSITLTKGAKDANRRKKRIRQVQRAYGHADGVISVSQGVAEDLREVEGLSGVNIRAIQNGVITPELLARSEEPVQHPWLLDRQVPTILTAGRLAKQKDHATLLRAFAELRKRTACNLLILGEGPERQALEAQALELGISELVSLPGYVENPFAWMRHADLFVLSSRWEGIGNVLVEALSLGVPLVSTDCPGGPREVLADGELGQLVPVGDPVALADAMELALDRSRQLEISDSAIEPFRVEYAARAYLEFFGIEADHGRA